MDEYLLLNYTGEIVQVYGKFDLTRDIMCENPFMEFNCASSWFEFPRGRMSLFKMSKISGLRRDTVEATSKLKKEVRCPKSYK